MSHLRIVLHAPTADSLYRARRNASNLLQVRPESEVVIIANGEAVKTALQTPDAKTDTYLRLCRNSLIAQGLRNVPGIEEVEAAIVALGELQAAGWAYVRA